MFYRHFKMVENGCANIVKLNFLMPIKPSLHHSLFSSLMAYVLIDRRFTLQALKIYSICYSEIRVSRKYLLDIEILYLRTVVPDNAMHLVLGL